MPEVDDIEVCKEAVLGYCKALNKWERNRYILGRIENGQFTSASDRESVAGLILESHHETHEKIFDSFVVPRERKYGSNPGAPNSWSKDGSYYDVDSDTIRAVEFPSKDRAEIVAEWGFQFPGGTTMFVLKRKNGTWLIDHLKISGDNGWEVAYL